MTDNKQMTIGALISALQAMPQEESIRFDFPEYLPVWFSSYRGYYEHFALNYGERSEVYTGKFFSDDIPALADDPYTVGRFLNVCKWFVRAPIEGWKGGEYETDENTPIWVANPGKTTGTILCGVRLTEYNGIILQTDIMEDE